MRQPLTCVLPLTAGLALLSSSASAQVLIDNLAEPIRAATVLGTEDPDRIWAAQSFATPTPYSLVSIEIPLGNAIGGPDAVAELHMGEDPTGPLLATFGLFPILSETSLELVMLLPDVPVTLDPDVHYWIVVGATSVGSFEWSFAEGNNFSGPGTIQNYMYSFDVGVTWFDYGADNPYHMRITVGPIGPDCTADFNADGVVNSQDFFDFLGAFFAEDPSADFNLDAAINSQDFFDFLSAFFSGC